MPYIEISDDDAIDLTVSVKEAVLVEGQSAIVYDADGNIVTQVVGPCNIVTPAELVLGVGTPDEVAAILPDIPQMARTLQIERSRRTPGEVASPAVIAPMTER